MTQHALAIRFRELHSPGADSILVLPNAWDAMSARLVEAAGAQAIATTSAGVSWSLGYPDGHGLTREAMIEAVRGIVRAVRVPVTADIEGGYGAGTPDDVAATVRGVIAAGAVGINLEDSPGHDGAALLDAAEQSARIAAARAAAVDAGIHLFINARIDTYLKKVGADEDRFTETGRRADAYTAAGADVCSSPWYPTPTDQATGSCSRCATQRARRTRYAEREGTPRAGSRARERGTWPRSLRHGTYPSGRNGTARRGQLRCFSRADTGTRSECAVRQTTAFHCVKWQPLVLVRLIR